MTVVRLNVKDDVIVPVPSGAGAVGPHSLNAALRRAIADLPAGAPINILLHGYRYSPLAKGRDPHCKIFATPEADVGQPPLRRSTFSWPTALGYGEAQSASDGLCLPVAWDAAGRFATAYHRAGDVAQTLAHLLDRLGAMAGGHPIHIMAHSLGARVALGAIAAAPAPVVHKLVLLAPAEFHCAADKALKAPGGAHMAVLQVSPWENRLFDRLLRRGLRDVSGPREALGLRQPEDARWTTLSLTDRAEPRLAGLHDVRIGPRKDRICHWSSYLRPGTMELYRSYLTTSAALPGQPLQGPVHLRRSRPTGHRDLRLR